MANPDPAVDVLAIAAQGYGCRELAVGSDVVELYGAMCSAYADCGLVDQEVDCPGDLYERIGRIDPSDSAYEEGALTAVVENACLDGCAGVACRRLIPASMIAGCGAGATDLSRSHRRPRSSRTGHGTRCAVLAASSRNCTRSPLGRRCSGRL